MATRTTKKPAAKRAPRRRQQAAQQDGPALTREDIRQIFAGMAVAPARDVTTTPGIANPPFALEHCANPAPTPETALQQSIDNAGRRATDLGEDVSRLLHRLGDSVLGPPLPAPPGSAQATPEPTTSRAVASINELADQIERVHGLVREIHERLEA